MHDYVIFNGPMPTSAAQAKVTTGTLIKTMLQLATPSTRQCQIISWGYSLDIAPTAVGEIELLQTDTAATVTAHVASGVQPLDPNGPASLLTLGTTATGYTSTGENAPAAVRTLDAREIPLAVGSTDLSYTRMWTFDQPPIIAVSKFVRVRATFTTAVNMLCWITESGC